MRDQITETALAAASAGNKTTIAGGSLAGFGWIASSEFAALCGVVIAILGLVINFYYRRKADAREEKLHLIALARETAITARAEADLRRMLDLNPPKTDTGD